MYTFAIWEIFIHPLTKSKLFQHQTRKRKMKCAEKLLALAFLHLAFSSILCFAACADTRRHGNGRNQNQKASSGGNTWCIAKPSTENARLNVNINYSCTQSGVNCRPIQPGGTCYHPNTIVSHASYAMNLFYKAAGKNIWNCHFNGTGIIISQDPSIGSCNYPM